MDISTDLKELVKSKGFMVGVNSEFCKIFKLTHKNCIGCESEDGCNRYVSLMGVMLKPIMYKPSSFEDYETMNKSIQKAMEIILNPDSTKEQIKEIS